MEIESYSFPFLPGAESPEVSQAIFPSDRGEIPKQADYQDFRAGPGG
jgi:hypothetical protein